MTSCAKKFTTKPRLHKIIHIIWTYNTVCMWVFFTSLFLWDSAHAKICKFDFRIRGLVVKSASQTSSHIGAIWWFLTCSLQGDSTAEGGATNHLCATVTHIPKKQEKSFFCKPIASGRYVSIRNAGKDVVVCEVEVYSTYTHSKFSF